MIPLKHKSYEERLRIVNLLTLKFRSIRGDTIELYKILTGTYDFLISPHFPLSSGSVTRGVARNLFWGGIKFLGRYKILILIVFHNT